MKNESEPPEYPMWGTHTNMYADIERDLEEQRLAQENQKVHPFIYCFWATGVIALFVGVWLVVR